MLVPVAVGCYQLNLFLCCISAKHVYRYYRSFFKIGVVPDLGFVEDIDKPSPTSEPTSDIAPC
jgi:hypothetical protein